MTIHDYLCRLKQWRQQRCLDRLILLILVLSNALLLIHCLNRKPTVELILPFMDGNYLLIPFHKDKPTVDLPYHRTSPTATLN